MSRLIENYLPPVKESGLNTNKNASFGANVAITGNLTVTGTVAAGSEATTSQVITAASANAFAVGAAGTTNPVFNVDTSVASVITGISVKGQVVTGGANIAVTSSGSNEALFVDAKGTGTIGINTIATTSGLVTIGNSTSLAGAAVNGLLTATSANANALAVGLAGTTNPALQVDASTASSATGIKVKSAAAAAGVAVSTISSGTDENLTLSAKGAGSLTFNSAVVAAAGGKVSSGIQYGSISVGLYTGTGAPSFSAMNGSIYTDSNATSTTTRIYVNKSGAGTAGTTWTALTTAA